jgi:putative ABC transport system permease protein
MLKNYIKQSWRSLEKNKGYSVLNIIGLSAGLTCFALIALWVSDEISCDSYFMVCNEKLDVWCCRHFGIYDRVPYNKYSDCEGSNSKPCESTTN